MATLTEERISVGDPGLEAGQRRRTPVYAALGIVVALLLGFGLGWLGFRDTGADVPGDVAELIEANEAAWNELDGEAVQALMAPGARHYALGPMPGPVASDGATSDDLVSLFRTGTPDGIDLDIQRVLGDDPYLVVSAGTAYGDRGFSVTHIATVDGELMIVDHIWTG